MDCFHQLRCEVDGKKPHFKPAKIVILQIWNEDLTTAGFRVDPFSNWSPPWKHLQRRGKAS
jgi:hypothetical protein